MPSFFEHKSVCTFHIIHVIFTHQFMWNDLSLSVILMLLILLRLHLIARYWYVFMKLFIWKEGILLLCVLVRYIMINILDIMHFTYFIILTIYFLHFLFCLMCLICFMCFKWTWVSHISMEFIKKIHLR